jgi:predicted DNA-binding protein
MPGPRLGMGRSKVLIIRIPQEWWEALEGMGTLSSSPPRELIREAIGSYLRKAKQI